MPLALAYLREAHRASPWQVEHGQDSGRRGVASRVLRCFDAIPLDCLEVLHKQWEASGLGIHLFSQVLTHLAWPTGTWLFAAACRDLERLMRDLSVVAEAEVGLDVFGGVHRTALASRRCRASPGDSAPFAGTDVPGHGK